MLRSYTLDRQATLFDDPRLIADAGLLLPATLAQRLSLRELLDRHVSLGAAPGRAHVADKGLTLVMSALAGSSLGLLASQRSDERGRALVECRAVGRR